MDFNFKVDVKAKSGSSYTMETIENRLASLIGVDTDVAREEVKFLERAKEKLAAKIAAQAQQTAE